MRNYHVTRKSDGLGVYAYTSDQASFLDVYPLAQYAHIQESLPTSETGDSGSLQIYGGRSQLTHEEFRNLFTDAERWGIDRFEAQYESGPLPEDVKDRIRSGYKSYYAASFINLGDQKVVLLIGVFVGLQLISVERMWEIMNG